MPGKAWPQEQQCWTYLGCTEAGEPGDPGALLTLHFPFLVMQTTTVRMELLTGMVGLPSVKPLETASAVLLELYLTNYLFFLIQQYNNQSEPSQTGLDWWIIFSCWLWNIFYDLLFLFYVYLHMCLHECCVHTCKDQRKALDLVEHSSRWLWSKSSGRAAGTLNCPTFS